MARNLNSKRMKRRKTAEHAEARLSIPASTFSEESARRIINDLLVPVLVEKFVRGKEISHKRCQATTAAIRSRLDRRHDEAGPQRCGCAQHDSDTNISRRGGDICKS